MQSNPQTFGVVFLQYLSQPAGGLLIRYQVKTFSPWILHEALGFPSEEPFVGWEMPLWVLPSMAFEGSYGKAG